MLSKWYCTTRSDTPASTAISRMLASCSPRSAAIRQTAPAISRRLRARVPGSAAGAGAAGTGGLFRCRYALAWQPREQYTGGRPRVVPGSAAPHTRQTADFFSSRMPVAYASQKV
ncbi:hypothetical protein GCM10010319_53000 [Streptomyces blastmyceticus]|uniref:Uncharacterized protein n=1 Tax=Streptomyces blastmyceticus TaxID=68180 RepID=A0ABP3HE26_9ACTN